MAKTIHVEYRVFDEDEALARATAQRFVEGIRAAVEARGIARIAISGGGSPKPVFALLADEKEPYRAAIPWDRLSVFWVDERCVPPDNADSNYGAANELLIRKVGLAADQVFRIEGELDPEEAAARYETAIRGDYRLEGAEIPIFDVLQLGMGDDGHTASLFPHTEALHEVGRIAVANHVPQQERSWRITLTWPVINAARDVFFLIDGAKKAEPVGRVLTGPYDAENLPSQLIQPRNGRLLFLLDRAAAAHLPAPDAAGVGTLEIAR
ncbi:MAG TPA: 6-phosphogluconolactonase [Acidobacteriaceae bacterium]|jgi:6-phosphogluconolactonase|nr:6-phosphogluconolactonase [Acidobacteriaceae bacterium]